MASLPMPSWPQEAIRLPAPVTSPAPQAIAPPARLSALEWSIVAMAESDTLSSLREPGRFASALGSLFGLRRPNRLANDRLEALRRLAVHAWLYRWNVPESEVDEFLAAGFSLDQYQLVQISIGEARSGRGRRTAR